MYSIDLIYIEKTTQLLPNNEGTLVQDTKNNSHHKFLNKLTHLNHIKKLSIIKFGQLTIHEIQILALVKMHTQYTFCDKADFEKKICLLTFFILVNPGMF